jgi:hypothetical protein
MTKTLGILVGKPAWLTEKKNKVEDSSLDPNEMDDGGGVR